MVVTDTRAALMALVEHYWHEAVRLCYGSGGSREEMRLADSIRGASGLDESGWLVLRGVLVAPQERKKREVAIVATDPFKLSLHPSRRSWRWNDTGLGDQLPLWRSAMHR